MFTESASVDCVCAFARWLLMDVGELGNNTRAVLVAMNVNHAGMNRLFGCVRVAVRG